MFALFWRFIVVMHVMFSLSCQTHILFCSIQTNKYHKNTTITPRAIYYKPNALKIEIPINRIQDVYPDILKEML